MEITKENLIEFGMKETTGDSKIIFPMEKVISIPNDEIDGELAICLTRMRNREEFCLMLPDGSCLYLNVNSMEDLRTFEKCIESWEPNY